MGAMNDELKIPKLEQDNYFAWSVRAKAALIQRNCWEAIEPGYSHSPLSESEGKINRKALSFLLLVVSDNYLDDIGHCETAKEAWDIVKDLNSNFGLLHVLILLKEMVNIEKTKNMTMQEYMSKIQNLNRKVATGGFNFDDRTLALFFLLGLPLDIYEGLVRSLEKEEENLTTKVIKSKLLLEEKRMNRSQHSSEDMREDDGISKDTKVMTAKVKSQHSKMERRQDVGQSMQRQESGKPRFVICFACGKKGHIAKNCFMKNKPELQTAPKEETINKASDKHAGTVALNHRVLCAARVEGQTKAGTWILDSGATDHMTPRREKILDFRETSATVSTANGEKLQVKGYGEVMIHLKEEYGGFQLTLTNVLFVPELDDNLLSVSRIEEKGYKQVIADGRITVTDDTAIIFTAIRKASLYCVEEKEEIKATVASKENIILWHKRLGHIHKLPVQNIETLKDNNVKSSGEIVKREECETCSKGKMKKLAIPKKGEHVSTTLLELIHSDVVGKITPPSLGRANYFVTFIDDYSRHVTVYPMSTKDEVLQKFDIYRKEVENEHDLRIKVLRSDNGGEYTSKAFREYLQENGIKHQYTIPYNPHQNGTAERMNQTLLSITRCQLLEANMPNYFWAESMNTACHVRNLCPSKGINGRIPHEVWTGQNGNLSYLRTFGCRAWVATREHGKLDARAVECVLLGYPKGMKGYRLWDINNRCVILSRDVIFEENVFPFRKSLEQHKQEEDVKTNTEFIISGEECHQKNLDYDVEGRKSGETTIPRKDGADNNFEKDVTKTQKVRDKNKTKEEIPVEPVRRSERLRKKKMSCYCNMTISNEGMDPQTPEEALSSPESEDWYEAMKEEMKNFEQNNSWIVVKRPIDKKVIGSKWVFCKKTDETSESVRYKARLVAQGFNQVAGVDYNETYSPVVKIKTLRVLMALAAELKWDEEHIDVVAAYLNSTLNDVVYMEQPKLFEEAGKCRDDFVCLLLKSIYGLHQSGRNWYVCIDEFLKENGFTQSKVDPCVYFSKQGDLVIALYVDDMACFGKRNKIEDFVQTLQETYRVKVLGQLSNLLSLRVTTVQESTILEQRIYTQEVLKEFEMDNARGTKTPLVVGEYYNEVNVEKEGEKIDETTYRKAIGSLLYLANGTRPDLSFAVTYMSQFCNKAKTCHWHGVKHILRYLKETSDQGITYKKTKQPLAAYVDSDWASDKLDRRSFSGFVIVLAGGAVSWQTRKQRTVALSTVEAEYVAMTEIVKEILWFQEFLQELHLEQFITKPTVVHVDNQGAICLARNPITSDRSKHIDVRYHFLRESVAKGSVEFQYILSTDNLADMFTKVITPKRLMVHKRKLGLSSAP